MCQQPAKECKRAVAHTPSPPPSPPRQLCAVRLWMTSLGGSERKASAVAMSTSAQQMLDTRCGCRMRSCQCRRCQQPPLPAATAACRHCPSPCRPLLPSPACSDFDRIDEEMRAYDEKREVVIKRSRDIQKLSKQAIFSMHRGAHEEAAQRLAAAKAGALELVPIIQANPMLRPGSYSAAVEEYAEVRCPAVVVWARWAGRVCVVGCSVKRRHCANFCRPALHAPCPRMPACVPASACCGDL